MQRTKIARRLEIGVVSVYWILAEVKKGEANAISG
jgi:hypothetical protein